jgi:hypothetical protein
VSVREGVEPKQEHESKPSSFRSLAATASNVAQSLAATASDVTQSTSAAPDSDVAQSLASMARNVAHSTVAATDSVAHSTSFTEANTEAELASFSPEMIAEDAAAREMLLEKPPLTPHAIETLLAIFHPIISLQLLTILPFIHIVADDAAAIKKLEEDRQAEAILKEFTKGLPIPLLTDSAANQLAMNNMMSPGHRVTYAFVAEGKKKKVVVPRKKKNHHPRHASPMFNDPVRRRCFLSILQDNPPTFLGKN